MTATETAVSAYTPTAEFLARTSAVYGPDSTYSGDMADITAAAREHAYLTAIAQTLAETTTGPAIATTITTIDHTYIPVLNFPDFADHADGFSVWAEWEDEGHEMNIVPFTADEFPLLPDGRSAGDHLKAAQMIREHAKTKGLL
jgi:hypothetical protein